MVGSSIIINRQCSVANINFNIKFPGCKLSLV